MAAITARHPVPIDPEVFFFQFQTKAKWYEQLPSLLPPYAWYIWHPVQQSREGEEKPWHSLSAGNTLGTVSMWELSEETLSNHLLANSPWELGWCYEWTSGCVEFLSLPQISGVSLDKLSKVALSRAGSGEVMLFLKGKGNNIKKK